MVLLICAWGFYAVPAPLETQPCAKESLPVTALHLGSPVMLPLLLAVNEQEEVVWRSPLAFPAVLVPAGCWLQLEAPLKQEVCPQLGESSLAEA